MTLEEFSNEFDVLISSYLNSPSYGEDFSNVNLAFNEYEKSVFLTKAQEELLLSYYNGINSKQEGYENTEEIRRYLNLLTTSIHIDMSDEDNYTTGDLVDAFDGYSDKIVELIENYNIWFITMEHLIVHTNNECTNGRRIEVVPITQDEFHRIINNPFRGVTDRRALRLETNSNSIEIISKYSDYTYIIYYLSKPSPIILTNLGDLTINNKSNATECRLHEALHRPILQRAVQLAILSRSKK